MAIYKITIFLAQRVVRVGNGSIKICTFHMSPTKKLLILWSSNPLLGADSACPSASPKKFTRSLIRCPFSQLRFEQSADGGVSLRPRHHENVTGEMPPIYDMFAATFPTCFDLSILFQGLTLRVYRKSSSS